MWDNDISLVLLDFFSTMYQSTLYLFWKVLIMAMNSFTDSFSQSGNIQSHPLKARHCLVASVETGTNSL